MFIINFCKDLYFRIFPRTTISDVTGLKTIESFNVAVPRIDFDLTSVDLNFPQKELKYFEFDKSAHRSIDISQRKAIQFDSSLLPRLANEQMVRNYFYSHDEAKFYEDAIVRRRASTKAPPLLARVCTLLFPEIEASVFVYNDMGYNDQEVNNYAISLLDANKKRELLRYCEETTRWPELLEAFQQSAFYDEIISTLREEISYPQSTISELCPDVTENIVSFLRRS